MTVAVSIIIPARDEAAYLPRLLASLERQRGVSMDVTIADAGSRDDTREIARRWGCAVTEGGLPGVGRNAGARLARSNQFVFLDADVEVPDAFLEKNIRKFQERGLAIGTTAYVPISNKRIDHVMHHAYNLFARATQRWHPLASGFCLFASREIHETIGGFDERIRLASDLNYVQRCARVGQFGILDGPPISVDVRRMDKEGRLGLLVKYTHGYLYRICHGEMYKSPIRLRLPRWRQRA